MLQNTEKVMDFNDCRGAGGGGVMLCELVDGVDG